MFIIGTQELKDKVLHSDSALSRIFQSVQGKIFHRITVMLGMVINKWIDFFRQHFSIGIGNIFEHGGFC